MSYEFYLTFGDSRYIEIMHKVWSPSYSALHKIHIHTNFHILRCIKILSAIYQFKAFSYQ